MKSERTTIRNSIAILTCIGSMALSINSSVYSQNHATYSSYSQQQGDYPLAKSGTTKANSALQEAQIQRIHQLFAIVAEAAKEIDAVPEGPNICFPKQPPADVVKRAAALEESAKTEIRQMGETALAEVVLGLYYRSRFVRRMCESILEDYGSTAIHPIVEGVKQFGTRGHAGSVLLRIGSRAYDELAELLASNDPQLRSFAVSSVFRISGWANAGTYKQNNPPPPPLLISRLEECCLQEQNQTTRQLAAKALRQISKRNFSVED